MTNERTGGHTKEGRREWRNGLLASPNRVAATNGAPGRDRTSTMLPSPDFESGASTNSATGAMAAIIGHDPENRQRHRLDTFAARGYANAGQAGHRMIARTLTLARNQPAAAAAIAIAAIGVLTMAGFFYFQYVLGYPPCPLCLEQRYAFYASVPLAAMIL